MEEAQLSWTKQTWEETWSCDSCHTMHTFPARLQFLEYVGITETHTALAMLGLLDFSSLSQEKNRQLQFSPRTLYLPK